MNSFLIGKALSPFASAVMLAMIRPWTLRLRRRMPDGVIKRILFVTWR